jgi:hypothetical protein
MTKLSNAFGANYNKMRREILTRKFELGGFTFKVRVPLVAESDAIYSRITNPEEEKIEDIYQLLVEPLEKFRESSEAQESGFEFLEKDILVQGKSLREAARNKALTEARIVEYIRLLVPEDPEATLADITYEDIQSEWPLNVQLALCEKIGEVISPNYKETRGN